MELRPATAGEMDDFGRAVMTAFHGVLTEEESLHYQKVEVPERSLAWFDDGRIVATTISLARHLTVPGATVPCAGVTAVATTPTHRRRGLMSSMLRRQLEDIHARGEPLAVLWASEGPIYGRFGYGRAAPRAQLVVHRPAARLAVPLPGADPLRAGPAAEHLDAMRAVFEQVRLDRPGMLDRDGPWWEARLFDPESHRKGAHALHAVVTADGYALYAVRSDWDDDGPAGEVVIRELVAATPLARAELWGFLIDQDLTRTVTWDLAPLDEPLWLMLADGRAARRSVRDGLWVRLVDVLAALAARTYACDPDVVLEVDDAVCPWNAGRYRLTAEGCAATSDEPDLALDVAALGTAYLGGPTLLELAAAGGVRELRPGALDRASAAFRAPVAPWCPEVF